MVEAARAIEKHDLVRHLPSGKVGRVVTIFDLSKDRKNPEIWIGIRTKRKYENSPFSKASNFELVEKAPSDVVRRIDGMNDEQLRAALFSWTVEDAEPAPRPSSE